MRHRRRKVNHTTSIFECQLQAAFQPPEREALVEEIKSILDLDGLVPADSMVQDRVDALLAELGLDLMDAKEAEEAVAAAKTVIIAAIRKSCWMDDNWVKEKVERAGKTPHKICHRRIGRA